MPVDGGARGDVRFRWSVVLGLVSGVLAIPLPHLPIPSCSRGDCFVTREISCLSTVFIRL